MNDEEIARAAKIRQRSIAENNLKQEQEEAAATIARNAAGLKDLLEHCARVKSRRSRSDEPEGAA